MKLQLGGSLSWYDPLKRSNLDIKLGEETSLMALINELSIPLGEVAIISINGEMFTGEDILVKDSDSILLFPPIGGGQK